jgi:hypothetical protein
MTLSATITTLTFEDTCTEEFDEEVLGLHLTDEEILTAFFRDGCDVDGTPLLMPDANGIIFPGTEKARTLH